MGEIAVLVVDDEEEIRNLIEIYLKNEGYNVLLAEDGISAMNIIKEHTEIKLIILDIMLPDIDGINVCKSIRKFSDIPIIMLSAKGEDNDKILGILSGSDDYMSKPFNPLELMVRVKAQLRRYLKNYVLKKDEIIIGDLKIDLKGHVVYSGDKLVKLTSKEFEVLELLAQNRGQVFNSKSIYESIWKEEFLENDSTIMTHIKNLRAKLGDNSRNTRYIKTVWGVGYKIDKD